MAVQKKLRVFPQISRRCIHFQGALEVVFGRIVGLQLFLNPGLELSSYLPVSMGLISA